jgi:hypothetical protein
LLYDKAPGTILSHTAMPRELIVIETDFLVTFLKAALLLLFVASTSFLLLGIIALYIQVRRSTSRSRRQGRKLQKDIDHMAAITRRNNTELMAGRDALDTLVDTWNFSMVQRSRSFQGF